MTRRSDQLNRIEGYARRLEEAAARIARALAEHGEDITAAKADAQAARSSAEAAHAGVQYLADTLPVPPTLNEAATAARRVPKTLKPRDM
jgi:hypothetical protein